MKKLVFGSLNIDRRYSVEDFVQKGETISAEKMELFCGGKGLNQAISLSRAGNEVSFAGAVGEDGEMLLEELKANQINVDHVKRMPGASGHAVIQVDRSGQNCIIILAGSNGMITTEDVDRVLTDFDEGDLIILQNEISNVAYILQKAHAKKMVVALNPSPCDSKIEKYDMNCVDYLLVNETEAAAIAGCTEDEAVLQSLHERYPSVNIIMTKGSEGSFYMGADGQKAHCGIHKVPVVDTTAAGDTFTGYFLSEVLKGSQVEQALQVAAVASGIAVSRAGAAPSIPYYEKVAQTYKRSLM